MRQRRQNSENLHSQEWLCPSAMAATAQIPMNTAPNLLN